MNYSHTSSTLLICPTRYSLFIPLYPIGIGAEWWLMFQAAKPVGEIHAILPYVFYFLLALYIPGEYCILHSSHFTNGKM